MTDGKKFKKIVWEHYKKHGRHTLPWRKTRTPYNIFVSEIMLQQTQVDRVIQKYHLFIRSFPTFHALAGAPLSQILREWGGLGYNRRALNLKRAAESIVHRHGGKLPRDYALLVSLPGVGPYTAGALLSFIWNEPMVFIETNIRTVFIHHFFPKRKNVSDTDIENKLTETLDEKNPREWYWALMDYGAYLKKTISNPSRASARHRTQKPFRGSNRELRGKIISLLSKNSSSAATLARCAHRPAHEVQKTLQDMMREGFIQRNKTRYSISS